MYHVLVVDDEKEIRDSLVIYLSVARTIYGDAGFRQPFRRGCVLAGNPAGYDFARRMDRLWAGSGETYKEPGFKSRRYQQMGEAMERMADRIRKIVDQNVKAERLKADLITNVSHDLKAPLTSIITYTRLMEKEGGLSAKSSHYLKVLLDKSTQLKRLTEDLLDAAKITSGNETIHPQQLHFGEMVLQANGEFAEMMDEKNLDIISKVPSETMDAWIDGAKTWRILSNLYANACKYALPQTRVYVDVSENENEVCFCMKNISKEPLNIPPDELMERFVRGDRARSGGGNGLGLAISGDLAKLQGGRLELEISGDLFTARLYLPKYKKAEKGVDACWKAVRSLSLVIMKKR